MQVSRCNAPEARWSAQMHCTCSDAQMLRCSAQMHCSDAQMLRCPDAQMLRCSGAQMHISDALHQLRCTAPEARWCAHVTQEPPQLSKAPRFLEGSVSAIKGRTCQKWKLFWWVRLQILSPGFVNNLFEQGVRNVLQLADRSSPIVCM